MDDQTQGCSALGLPQAFALASAATDNTRLQKEFHSVEIFTGHVTNQSPTLYGSISSAMSLSLWLILHLMLYCVGVFRAVLYELSDALSSGCTARCAVCGHALKRCLGLV